ncbi:acyl-CoA thioesterase [Sporobolomyces salmoneus]|uniref:acyl-CoA thioesterase n=1 Tax=Sporobolomyces salmoneus TaxID=183962 RepID=UPI003177E205
MFRSVVSRSLPARSAFSMISSRPSSSIAPPGNANPEAFPAQRAAALAFAKENGYWGDCLVEIPVEWGTQDPNNHVNNAVYLRWLESGRLNAIRTLSNALPEAQAKDLRGSGKGKGVILARLTYDYLRTTHHPDTILVLHKVSSVSARKMIMEHAIYSYDQSTLVGKGECVLVGYNYDTLKSTEWPSEVRKLVEERGAKSVDSSAKL